MVRVRERNSGYGREGGAERFKEGMKGREGKKRAREAECNKVFFIVVVEFERALICSTV